MLLRFSRKFAPLLLICFAMSAAVHAGDDQGYAGAAFAPGAPSHPGAVSASKSDSVETGGFKRRATAVPTLSVYGRVQIQHINFESDAKSVANTESVMARRRRLGILAKWGERFVADVNVEFGDENINRLILAYRDRIGETAFDLSVGIRKVNFGWEENKSSARLKAIERSGTTRYFVEDNNGRRLGAGKQRLGIFLDVNPAARAGKSPGLYFGASVTNPKSPGDGWRAISDGVAPDGKVAIWADVGFSGYLRTANYRLGTAGGFLPDQGGRQSSVSHDLSVFSVYGALEAGRFSFASELMAAWVERGGTEGADVSPWGAWIESSASITEHLELTARASYTDADGRGIRVSDGVRSTLASLTGDNLTEVFVGLSYYIMGHDLKLQTGYVRGWTERNDSRETSDGLRSMVTFNF